MKYPPKKIGLRHIDWVGLIVATDLPSLSKLLAYQLSSYMNRDQNIAWPSQTRLMAETSMSKGALNKHLKLLEDEGWILRRSGNHTETTRYQIAFPRHIERVVHQMDEGSIRDELPSSPDGLGVVHEVDTNIQLNIQDNIQVKDKSIKQNTKDKRQSSSNNKKLDFTIWPDLPDDQTLKDWLDMRKRLKANVSQTVIKTFGKELTIAVDKGFSVDYCLSECVTRNWRGFKAEWITKDAPESAKQRKML